ncbi:MAG: hypothetical protein ABSB69_08145, partial [Solirubrobacteraceae bacterium]
MATRTIVTSQPDVACDVCGRRLLRGEQPDVFVGAGRRRIVCELCAPRAAHEGWMRETDSQSLSLSPMRPRRGRSLFERLRQVGRPPGEASADLEAPDPDEPQAEPYDLFADAAPADPAPADAAPAATTSRSQPVAATPPEALVADLDDTDREPLSARHAEAPLASRSETHASQEQPSEYVQQAIAVFNASEFPRRVAGVTRSLGAPAVTVRSAEHLDSVVSIVVAWELCWYRY